MLVRQLTEGGLFHGENSKSQFPRREHAWHVEGMAKSDLVEGGDSGQEVRKWIVD